MREFRVYGLPAPQGSKTFKGFDRAGHAYLEESSKNVKPWREAVKWAYIQERLRLDWPTSPMDGALQITILFFMPPPKKHAGLPISKPDLDKLCRATFDALSKDVGAVKDDSRFTDLIARKRYAKADQPAGAIVRIETVSGIWRRRNNYATRF